MSQNDFVIANQTAPTFRADLNTALQALASNSSGATAPSSTYANMLWYDTATNILKMRSEADDAWISLGTLDQSLNTFTPEGLTAKADLASPTFTGIPLAPTATSGTNTTQLATTAFVSNSAIGIGQTWQDVSGSRAADTSYQNTTGRPIGVCVYQGDSSLFRVSEDNVVWLTLFAADTDQDGGGMGGIFVIPDNYYYIVTVGLGGGPLWHELR